jgi:hypothetical protein
MLTDGQRQHLRRRIRSHGISGGRRWQRVAVTGPLEVVVRSSRTRETERAAAWLGELPTIVDELRVRWEDVPDGDAW